MNFINFFKKKPKKRYWVATVGLWQNGRHRGNHEVHCETDGEYPNASVIRFNALAVYQSNGIDCNKAVINYPIVELSKEDMDNHLKIDPKIKALSEQHQQRSKYTGKNTRRDYGKNKRLEIEARKNRQKTKTK